MKKALLALMVVLLAAVLIVSCDDKLKKVCTVTFVSNGGSSVSDVEVENGEKVTKPTNPTKDGYEFSKWTTDEEGNEEYNFDTAITSDITLYAQWIIAGYRVGSKGPAGGIIIYDVDADNNNGNWDGLKSEECGWRYLEAGTSNLVDNSHTSDIGPFKFKFGPEVSTPSCETGEEIGDGLDNTNALLAKGTDYEAANICATYSVTVDGKTYDDWFLPSSEELYLIYKQNSSLALKEGTKYWSSSYNTTVNNGYATYLNSDSGDLASCVATTLCYVRPVRRFK